MSANIRDCYLFVLKLNEPHGIYYSGQVLKGTLECNFEKPLIFSAITVLYTGSAKVHWRTKNFKERVRQASGRWTCVDVNHSDTEYYFNEMHHLAGRGEISLLPEGCHSIPFQFLVPKTAPSTYSCKNGTIAYKLTVSVDYSDQRLESTRISKTFTVVAPLDLNKCHESVKRPIELKFEKVYGVCCVKQLLQLKLTIPAAGFCPGQPIPVNVHANNQSAIKIRRLIFQIIERKCFRSRYSQDQYMPSEKVLGQAITGRIHSGAHSVYSSFDFRVPKMIAPNVKSCRLINIRFFFKVKAVISGYTYADSLEEESEFFVGLVPLSEFSGTYVHPMRKFLPTGPIPDDSEDIGVVTSSEYPVNEINLITNVTSRAIAPPYPAPNVFPISNTFVSDLPPTNVPYPLNPISNSYDCDPPPYESLNMEDDIPVADLPQIGFINPDNNHNLPYAAHT